MPFAAALSTDKRCNVATDETLDMVSAALADRVDFLAVFFSGHATTALETLAQAISKRFPNAFSIGCSAEGVIGTGREVERRPALSVLAARLERTELRPFVLPPDQLERFGATPRSLGLRGMNDPSLVVVGDPATCDVGRLLRDVNEGFPGRPIIGGLASASNDAGGNVLLSNGVLHREGLVGLAFGDGIKVQTVVSQGCRPIGQPFIVTKAEKNVIAELGGRPAVEVLHEVAKAADDAERTLLRTKGTFLGRAIDEYRSELGRGDFLIHAVVGIIRETGALVVGGPAIPGTTVQFHVRDAAAADEDLRELLSPHSGDAAARGALVFSCNGRGTRMWSEPGHDAGVLAELLPETVAAGLFCAGEIGPIGGRNFIHGFTASLALLGE